MVTEKTAMNIQDLSIEILDECPWNPNEMDDLSFNRLYDELNENGFIDPIQVVPIDNGRFQVLGGNHRFKAAKLLGINDERFKKIPCVVLSEEKWKDEDLRKFVNLRLNVLRGKLNPTKFVDLYKDMVQKYGDDALQELMGFTSTDAWDKLVGSVRDALAKTGLPEDLVDKFDDKTKKEIKTVDGLAGILKGLFTEYGNTLPFGFMVFTFGGQDNIYVKLDEELKDKMWQIKERCYESKVDVADVLNEIISVEKLDQIIGICPVVVNDNKPDADQTEEQKVSDES
jgi:hypothetical protein